MKKGLFLPEELLEFPDEVVHPADDREEGLFAREVDARGLDLLDRVVAAAALEEAFVALEGAFGPFVDPAVKFEGGGEARRVLIDVERRVVKVRDVAPDEGLVDLLGEAKAGHRHGDKQAFIGFFHFGAQRLVLHLMVDGGKELYIQLAPQRLRGLHRVRQHRHDQQGHACPQPQRRGHGPAQIPGHPRPHGAARHYRLP